MTSRRNYYHILHVQADAPDAVIRASYRALMQKLKLHPDLGGDESSAAVLNEAYATLSDSSRRAAYDLHLQQNAMAETTEHKQTGVYASGNIDAVLRIASNDTQCPFCGTDNTINTKQASAHNCIECGSPLSASTSHLQSINSAGRALERQYRNAPIKYFTDTSSPAQFGVLCNLSPLGLQFQLSRPLDANQVIKLECDSLTAIAKVRNCRENTSDGHFTAGVEFITSRFYQRRGTFFSDSVC